MMSEKRNEPTAAPEDVRRAAIDHHHDVASIFEDHYRTMERDRFSTAFTYGRYKVDVVLDRELDRLPRGAKVLDIGCGTGPYLRRFAAKGLVPFGVEPAEGMLAVARRDNPGTRVEQGVATSLPFEDESFDGVTCIEVLRYLHDDDVQRSISEILRVLKPGGFFFVTLVNRLALDGFYVLQRLRQRKKGVEFDRRNPHCEFTTPRETEEALVRSGAVNVRTIGRLFAPMRIAYKAHPGLASRIAARIESLEDHAHEALPWTKPFAGHLIAIGERPRREGDLPSTPARH